ncbi:MAG: hypothetical protein ACJAWL_002368 [Motiliproteus sp.]|jgi:hypothetical protein
MAKAASPVRLEKNLMEAAKVVGDIYHRSAAEQVEYWADIGRNLSKMIDPDTLVQIAAGLARVNVEQVAAPVVNPEDVFASLETDRASGRLAAVVTASAVKYQASASHRGLLERISPGGGVETGSFTNGVFIALQEPEH